MLVIGMGLIIGAILAAILLTMGGASPIIIIAVPALIALGGFAAGGVGIMKINQPVNKCANNILTEQDDSSIAQTLDYNSRNNTAKENNLLTISPSAKVVIEQAEKLSPGLKNDLIKYFNEHLNALEDPSKNFRKNDLTSFEELIEDWNKIMDSTKGGMDSFCTQVGACLSKKKGLDEHYANQDKNTLQFSQIPTFKALREKIEVAQTKPKLS